MSGTSRFHLLPGVTAPVKTCVTSALLGGQAGMRAATHQIPPRRSRTVALRLGFTALVLSVLALASCQNPATNTAAPKERPTPVVLNFDEDAPGALPEGWRPAIINGAAADIEWRIATDSFAPSRPNVLALARAGNDRRASNLCIWHRDVLEDVELRVSCSGDYGAGIAFRLDDQLNGYVARVNPAEGNLRLFKLVDGERISLSGQPLRYADADGWYRLIVSVRDDVIHVVLEGYDGRLARRNELEHRDESFVRPGRVALWTRADSLGRFDDVEIRPLE